MILPLYVVVLNLQGGKTMIKITIEQDGKEPKVFENITGYQLIVATNDTTTTVGTAGEEVGLAHTVAMAQAVEKLHKKFKPFIAFWKACEELSDEED